MNIEFILTFIICLFLLGVFIKYASRMGFVDTPNLRSSHKRITPSCCGIAILLSIIIISLFSDFILYQTHEKTVLAIFLVFAVGVLDDLKNIRARYKLIAITFSSILVILDGFLINNIGTYFNNTLTLLWLAIPFTLFAITAFTNSLNLIDGIDGLAGTISLIIFSSLWYLGKQNNDILIIEVTTLLIPAILAFLVINWNPAKAFMGDSGSLMIGFIIAILSIKALSYVNPIVILYLLALPIIDTLVVVIKRKSNGHPIFSPDKNHVHHVLLQTFNGNVRKTVTVMALAQVSYTAIGIMLVINIPQQVSLLFFILNIAIWYGILSRLSDNLSKMVVQNISK